ncbi:hypothetical protein MH117_03985 [Paenibacillus sp. ACRRX]|uniref:DUF7638 domain-containing protein n=1 Tax=unclassified Paenibacillus TaxID=185978 RepID=UPI001EF6B209|nr:MULTISPECIES: hypothetical protein [unclassified Paenibacillus]MCG7406566.1 hypothetical protein [Paenibacillus sp. ACRRX]MDK8179598.1 hypothetical protein [Paenibacillus sp. UMB4589-SE434]
MQKIRRTKEVEGVTVPGIIHNGGHYFYINVDVYEDGMSNCWELVDLNGLKEKLSSNWLNPSIPESEDLSIHALGMYTVQKAEWIFDKDTYYEHIKDTIKTINPNFENIYEITSWQKQLAEKRKIMYSPRATNYYVMREMFYETIDGDQFSIFIKYENINYLANLVVYEDGLVICYFHENKLTFRLEEIYELFTNGTFFTSFDEPTKVMLSDLGEVTFSQVVYSTEIEDKYIELMDIHKKLKGEKTSLEECREAYYQYLEDPIEYYRQNLKVKYELVPEHERIFLGDMDSKDWDYQRIIYRPEEKREV